MVGKWSLLPGHQLNSMREWDNIWDYSISLLLRLTAQLFAAQTKQKTGAPWLRGLKCHTINPETWVWVRPEIIFWSFPISLSQSHRVTLEWVFLSPMKRWNLLSWSLVLFQHVFFRNHPTPLRICKSLYEADMSDMNWCREMEDWSCFTIVFLKDQ